MKSIYTFIVTQIINVAVLYFIQEFVFKKFSGTFAWMVYGVMVLVFVIYFIYDLILLVRKRKLVKNFNW